MVIRALPGKFTQHLAADLREAIAATHVRDEYGHLHHVTELATRLLQSAVQILKKLSYLAVKVARERFTVVVQNAPYFVGFPPPQSHRDKAVLKAQTWGAHAGRTRRLACGHGSNGGIAEAHIPPPVRQIDRYDAPRDIPHRPH